MDLATIADELYGLPPEKFTAARNARASEASHAGDRELAASVKKLAKPPTAAWLANTLARERGAEIKRLIRVGETLRSARSLNGERIRQASKEKVDVVSQLLRHARVIADRAPQIISQATFQDLEVTLDAAFADAESATALREGRLTTALHYSGLGFEGSVQYPRSGPSGRTGVDMSSRSAATAADKARLTLKEANQAAERADAELKAAKRAVRSAESDLTRLQAALTVAERQATKARQRSLDARKKVEKLTRSARR